MADAQSTLGIAYCFLNQPKLADAAFNASLSIFKQLFGEDSVSCARALTGLCVSSFLIGDIPKSKAYGKRAISTFDVYPGVSYYRGKCKVLFYSILIVCRACLRTNNIVAKCERIKERGNFAHNISFQYASK